MTIAMDALLKKVFIENGPEACGISWVTTT